VATNDMAIVLTFRTLGAFPINADDLVDRIEDLVQVQTRVMNRNQARNKSQWKDITLRSKLKGL